MYARVAWAQSPYAGNVLPAPVVGLLPPPIPGDTASFSYTAQLGRYPWAYGTWAGGYPPAAYPGGGVLAHPNAERGVVSLQAWWPYTAALQLVRITLDGGRTAVRGGYPITVSSQSTRRNHATNPSLETGLNGYTPDVGNPTLSQLTDAAAPAGTRVLRATVAGAGSCGVTIPTALIAPPTNQPLTVAFAMRLSALPSSVTVTIGWTNSGGGALTTNSVVLSANQIINSVGQFGRQVINAIPPPGAVTPTLKVIAAGMPAGGSLDLDAITVEIGITSGAAFDGTTAPGAIWLGTAHLSASVLAPVVTVADGECPLDTWVAYQVSYPGITGGLVVSDSVMLASQGRAWLTHPAVPAEPQPCRPTVAPVLTRAAVQASFAVIGRSNPVVVTSKRLSPTGTLTLDTATFAERDQLLVLLADGAPLLLRAPADFGLGYGWWLALGDVTEDPVRRPQWSQGRAISMPFTLVDGPPVG